MTSVSGYGVAQLANAAVIAAVAQRRGMGDRGALLGVMCAMGESSLRNIDYGDWETNGVRNPDGSPTSSIGLFQQQAWWGSPAERMDARYAAGAFSAALERVRDWQTLAPTIAIHRVQINADPNHYAKYEAPARAVLAYIAETRAKGGTFMAAPEIEWIRDGVGFRPDAAAAFRRAEAGWGSPIRCNSTYRDYGLQLSMWQAWTAWAEGRGPKPNHSRALHPDDSMHCQGLACDTNLWTVEGFIAHMEDHGFIRTAAWDPTEQHHFEYQWWRDNHRNEQAPAATDARPKEWDEMASEEQIENLLIKVLTKNDEVSNKIALAVKNELDKRKFYADLSILTIDELNKAKYLFAASTQRMIHIQNPAHVPMIERAAKNDGNDIMSSSEIDIFKAYCLAVYPPEALKVDIDALSLALKPIGKGQSGVTAAVAAAVDAHTSAAS